MDNEEMKNPVRADLAIAVSLAIVLFFVPGYLILTQLDGPFVSGTGTIEYIGLEGGFYGIISDDGERYDPLNLEEEFQVDGLRVAFGVIICHDCASFHMWGKIVRIVHMEEL